MKPALSDQRGAELSSTGLLQRGSAEEKPIEIAKKAIPKAAKASSCLPQASYLY